jgi:hypothetical protein
VPLFLACVIVATAFGLVLASAVFVLFSAPFAVVDAIPAIVTAFTWPFVSLLVTFGYANGVATLDPAPAPVAA